jgi:hypothetical protein
MRIRVFIMMAINEQMIAGHHYLKYFLILFKIIFYLPQFPGVKRNWHPIRLPSGLANFEHELHRPFANK